MCGDSHANDSGLAVEACGFATHAVSRLPGGLIGASGLLVGVPVAVAA